MTTPPQYESVVIYTDGGAAPTNPGPAGYGVVVFDADEQMVLAELADVLGHATNNVAEYQGAIAGLRWAVANRVPVVTLRTDSKLVVEQLNGRWRVHNLELKVLHGLAAELIQRVPLITVEWVPRARNEHADRLYNQVMCSVSIPIPYHPPSPKEG